MMKIIKKIILMGVLVECTVVQAAPGKGWWPFYRAQDPIIPATLASKKKQKDDLVDATLKSLVNNLNKFTQSEQIAFAALISEVQAKTSHLIENEHDEKKASELILDATAQVLATKAINVACNTREVNLSDSILQLIIINTFRKLLDHESKTKNRCNTIRILFCNDSNFAKLANYTVKFAETESSFKAASFRLENFLESKLEK